MAEFCKECSKKLNFEFDRFYEGEICENCGKVNINQKFNIFTFIRNLIKI